MEIRKPNQLWNHGQFEQSAVPMHDPDDLPALAVIQQLEEVLSGLGCSVRFHLPLPIFQAYW